ncbi:MAG: hypothetical protein JOY68_06450 [Candidatus Dormibacteraeota bacterium]|nr:hypothetical protein [Candidatus Dormibacteraeota bacterium]MBV8444347.1 hypothetical protein [Candidatus Dormibacteraeota bacterium]
MNARRFTLLLLAVLCAATAAACDSTPQPTASTSSPTLTNRPSSPVHITLVSPTNNSVVHGNKVHVVVSISGGVITQQVSTHISPTVGHVHLYFNNQLVYMSYTLQEDIPVQPGLEYTMYAEFVAQDHLPFNPRDVTPSIFFTVAPS